MAGLTTASDPLAPAEVVTASAAVEGPSPAQVAADNARLPQVPPPDADDMVVSVRDFDPDIEIPPGGGDPDYRPHGWVDPSRLATEQVDAPRFEYEAAQHLGARFGGLWLTDGGERFVLGVVGATSDDTAWATSQIGDLVDVADVVWGYGALQYWREYVSAAVQAVEPRPSSSLSIDLAANRVELQIDRPTAALTTKLHERIPADAIAIIVDPDTGSTPS